MVSSDDFLDEIDACKAKGASFTGGEPLGASFDKVVALIRVAKENTIKNFHVHLYTTGIGVGKNKLELLGKVGLDEIRFHPPPGQYEAIKEATVHVPDVGCEVPVVPSKAQAVYVQDLVEFLALHGGKFINLNEFEITETNAACLEERGFLLKEETFAAVSGSEAAAMDLLEWWTLNHGYQGVAMHYCPIFTKDEHQLRMRYLRRAKSTRLSHEVVTGDGTVLFGEARVSDPQEAARLYSALGAGIKKNGGGIILDRPGSRLLFHPALARNAKFMNAVSKALGNDVRVGLVEALPLDERQECEFTPLTWLEDKKQ